MKELATVTHIHFSPASPYNFAVTSGAQVSLLNLVHTDSSVVPSVNAATYVGACMHALCGVGTDCGTTH